MPKATLDFNKAEIIQQMQADAVGIIPDHWNVRSVSELVRDGVLDKIQDGNHGEIHPVSSDYVSVGIHFLMSGNIRNGRVDTEQCKFLRPEHAKSLRVGHARRGDVLLTHKGNDLGRVAILHDVEWAVLTPQITYYRIKNQNVLVPEFLKCVFESPVFQHQFKRDAEQSTRPFVSISNQQRLFLPIPPLAEQRAIANILGVLDDKIELNRRMNETLEGLARAIFQSWFVDFDPVRMNCEGGRVKSETSDFHPSPFTLPPSVAALFPDSFEDSELGKIPKGWDIRSLADIMDIQGGTQPPASEFLSEPCDGYIRLVQIRDYETDSHLTFIPDTHKLRKCRRDDVMIARYGASVARICWGLDGAYNVALVKAAPANPCYREFLRSYLQAPDFQARLIGMSNRSVQAGFNKGDIASFKIACPPDAVFGAYQELAWSLRRQVLQNRDQSRAVAAIRDALLPKLLSGEIRVAEAERLVEDAG